MVATASNEPKSRTILVLTSNGANVKPWDDDVQSFLLMESQSQYLMPEFSMPVPAKETLALSVDVAVAREIEDSRAKEAKKKTQDEALRKEDPSTALKAKESRRELRKAKDAAAQKATPRATGGADHWGGLLGATGGAQEQAAGGTQERAAGETQEQAAGGAQEQAAGGAAEEKAAEGAAAGEDAAVDADTPMEEKVSVDGNIVHDNEMARAEREHNMRVRARAIGARMKQQQDAITERRGGRTMVSFLNPLTARTLHDTVDRDTVCHVHTFNGETLRYEVESPDMKKVRMRLDSAITHSLALIPSHITTGVEPGNIYERYRRVVLYYDDVSRRVVMEAISDELGMVCMRERETFAGFTSRFKAIEHRMQEVSYWEEPDMMLAKLERALYASKGGVVGVLGQVKLVVGLTIETTAQLFAAMDNPMRVMEKNKQAEKNRVKANQEKVNAVHAVERKAGKGKGRGGKGGKGGKGSKGAKSLPCLDFAEGACDRTNCHFSHVAMGPGEIKELKATIARKLVARGAGKAKPQRKSVGVHTVQEVKNAFEAETTSEPSMVEKIRELAADGLSQKDILRVADVVLGSN